MKRRISFLSRGVIIFTALFYFFGFWGDFCSGLESNTKTIINIHYERGVRFYKEHEYDKAIKELKKVLEMEPSNVKAKKYLTAATNRKNKNMLEELCREADILYKQKEYQKAMDTYKKALEIKPGDGYVSYKMALLQAKMNRLGEARKNTQSKLRQSKKELERLNKQREKKERLLKKQVESELNKEEKEEQKKQAQVLKEGADKKDAGQKKVAALESKTIPRQAAPLRKHSLRPDSSVLAKDIEQNVFLSQKINEIEKLYRIKFLFELGEKYYNEEDYHRAIEVFQEVIDLEDSPAVFYTPYAQDYIERAKGKLQEQIGQDKLKQMDDIENEMVNKIIDSKRPLEK